MFFRKQTRYRREHERYELAERKDERGLSPADRKFRLKEAEQHGSRIGDTGENCQNNKGSSDDDPAVEDAGRHDF